MWLRWRKMSDYQKKIPKRTLRVTFVLDWWIIKQCRQSLTGCLISSLPSPSFTSSCRHMASFSGSASGTKNQSPAWSDWLPRPRCHPAMPIHQRSRRRQHNSGSVGSAATKWRENHDCCFSCHFRSLYWWALSGKSGYFRAIFAHKRFGNGWCRSVWLLHSNIPQWFIYGNHQPCCSRWVSKPPTQSVAIITWKHGWSSKWAWTQTSSTSTEPLTG